MTLLAPHLTAFFREHLSRDRARSTHTCDAYAYSFQLLLCFAAKRYDTTPFIHRNSELKEHQKVVAQVQCRTWRKAW